MACSQIESIGHNADVVQRRWQVSCLLMPNLTDWGSSAAQGHLFLSWHGHCWQWNNTTNYVNADFFFWGSDTPPAMLTQKMSRHSSVGNKTMLQPCRVAVTGSALSPYTMGFSECHEVMSSLCRSMNNPFQISEAGAATIEGTEFDIRTLQSAYGPLSRNIKPVVIEHLLPDEWMARWWIIQMYQRTTQVGGFSQCKVCFALCCSRCEYVKITQHKILQKL